MKTIKNENFDKLKEIDYSFFTRHGGVCVGDLESLNTSAKKESGSSKEEVLQNLEIIQNYFNSPYKVLKLKQLHSNQPFILEDLKDVETFAEIEADSIITKIKNVVVGVSTADCTPIFIYDKNNQIISAIHAGWKGIITRIIQNTINKMKEISNNEQDLEVLIGPHLRVENFEVKEDFLQQLQENNIDKDLYIIKKDDKMLFDITKLTYDILKSCNVKNFYDTNIDTYTDLDFFSYRRACHQEKTRYGNQFSGIILK